MAESFDVFHIFTPTTQATVNFVERDQLNERLVDSLRTPGKQIVVYGPSGSGKSTLLVNKLRQLYSGHVTTQCRTGTTFEQILLEAFDKLGPFYTSAETRKAATTNAAELEYAYAGLKAKISDNLVSEVQTTSSRVVPPQLTVSRLAEFMGAAEVCWVVEDFHKMDAAEKVKLSQSMKVFYDQSSVFGSVKIIVIGAVGTAREVIEYDAEMNTRVAEIEVPLMGESELMQILENGCDLLNIRMPSGVRGEIVRYAAGLASACHQLALNMCLKRGVYGRCESMIVLGNGELYQAVDAYVQDCSDTLKSAFEKALRRTRIRKYDNNRIIIGVLCNGPYDGMQFGEIHQMVRKQHPEYPAGNLQRYLSQLQQETNGGVVHFDGKTGKYSFSSPLYHAFARAITPRSKGEPEMTVNTSEVIKRLKELVAILGN